MSIGAVRAGGRGESERVRRGEAKAKPQILSGHLFQSKDAAASQDTDLLVHRKRVRKAKSYLTSRTREPETIRFFVLTWNAKAATAEDHYAQFMEVRGVKTPFIIDRFTGGK